MENPRYSSGHLTPRRKGDKLGCFPWLALTALVALAIGVIT